MVGIAANGIPNAEAIILQRARIHNQLFSPTSGVHSDNHFTGMQPLTNLLDF